MAEITVRPATREDAPRIVEFQLLMARETESLELDPATVRRGVSAIFEDPAKGRYFMAVEGTEVGGCLLTVPEWSDWRAGTVLWIHSVYVRPEWRKRGAFRALYAHLETLVRGDAGLKGLRLYVDKRNARAQKVYEALGMTAEHYVMYEWLK